MFFGGWVCFFVWLAGVLKSTACFYEKVRIATFARLMSYSLPSP